MSIVKISPQAEDRPYLSGGTYGPDGSGAQYEVAECKVVELIGQVPPGEGPGYDRDCERNQWSKWTVRIRTHEGVMVMARGFQPNDPESGGQTLPWVRSLGVAVGEDGTFDDEDVKNLDCLVTLKPHRSDANGVKYTGDISKIVGL